MQGSSFRLIVRRGPQPNQIYELSKGIITLGRDITNDIVINDPEVSRHHCRLTQGGGGYTIEDLGSTNGTFINGQRLTGARPLANGDMLGMGETVTLAYEASLAGMPAVPGQVQTVVSPSSPAAAEYAPPPQTPGYGPRDYGQPPSASGGYPAAGVPPVQQPYGAPMQQPMAYDYDYQEEPYEGGGVGRWIVLGCGCFIVVCIVVSVISAIIIDSQCMWDDVPVVNSLISAMGLQVDESACQ
jgi:hypothetical protein